MRSFLLISVALLIMFPSLVRFEKVVYFYANRSAIANELCENKNVKGSCCHGACVLKKELKKAAEEKPLNLPSAWKVKTEWVMEASFDLSCAIRSSKIVFGIRHHLLKSDFHPREQTDPPGWI